MPQGGHTASHCQSKPSLQGSKTRGFGHSGWFRALQLQVGYVVLVMGLPCFGVFLIADHVAVWFKFLNQIPAVK